ncbi:protein Mis18-alpha-like isoform X3 [Acropora palmata]|uniref:protein Mis18-alpha-like isoform X3 n=1 Tax=Acropora palmata TaxID=6131 RepID=UPI003D9FFA64
MAANSLVPADSNLTFEQSFKEGSPVVFQCKSCKSIVGDSCAFVSSDRELEVICVSAVTSIVTLGDVLETSTEGADMGRNMFCFNGEHIDSYQVGSVVDRQNTSVTTEKILDIPTAKMLETRISKIECVVMMLLEKMGQVGDSTNTENVSTMAENQPMESSIDCCDTMEEKEKDKVKKTSKKKRNYNID